MIRWFKALFAWQNVKTTGRWLYQENSVNGRRQAISKFRGHNPVDLDWLDAGNGHPLIDGKPAWRTGWGQIDGRYTFI